MYRIPADKSRSVLACGLLAALVACTPAAETRQGPPPDGGTPGVTAAPAPARAALPPEACTREGAWAFFEEFVRRQDVRDGYSRVDLHAGARPGTDNFRIALVDNRWVYVDPALSEAEFSRVRLTSSRDGDVFRVEYAVAEFGPDDEVVKRLGPTGRYAFEFRDGCWILARAEP